MLWVKFRPVILKQALAPFVANLLLFMILTSIRGISYVHNIKVTQINEETKEEEVWQESQFHSEES